MLKWQKTSKPSKQWKCRVKFREAKLKRRKTPGTYDYNEKHGFGLAGAQRRLNQRRSYRARADARDAVQIALLEKELAWRV